MGEVDVNPVSGMSFHVAAQSLVFMSAVWPVDYLIKRAANVRFIGVEDDTSFVEALIRGGRLLEQCRAYLEVVRASAGASLNG